MTTEEALKLAKKVIGNDYTFSDIAHLARYVIQQNTAAKPIYTGIIASRCECKRMLGGTVDKFCPNCGRKLDWRGK